LEVDFNKYKHLSENELLEGCVAYLNLPLPRKRKSKYGDLAPVIALWKAGGYEVTRQADRLAVCLSTDARNNKNFWDKGSSIYFKEDGRKKKKSK